VYFFGGRANGYKNTVHSFDPNETNQEKAWKLLKTTGAVPSARYGASATLIHSNGKDYMLVFGGFDELSTPCNDVFILDLNSLVWEEIKPSGNNPTARFHHTSNLINGNELIIFGGQDAKRASLGDGFILNFSAKNAMQWTPIDASGSPHVYGHASFIFGPCLYIFGGLNKEKNVCTNDLHSYHFVSHKWQLCTISGESPSPRHFHSIQPSGRASFLLLGGQDFNKVTLKDSFVFNIVEGLGFLKKLPFDILGYIFINFISPQDVKRLCLVSKQMYELGTRNDIWKLICKSRLPEFEEQKDMDYRQHYFEMTNSTVWINPNSPF